MRETGLFGTKEKQHWFNSKEASLTLSINTPLSLSHINIYDRGGGAQPIMLNHQ